MPRPIYFIYVIYFILYYIYNNISFILSHYCYYHNLSDFKSCDMKVSLFCYTLVFDTWHSGSDDDNDDDDLVKLQRSISLL